MSNNITVRVGKFDESLGHGFDKSVDVVKLGFPEGILENPVARGIIKIGLRNILTDLHAGITKKAKGDENAVELATEAVDEKLADMYKGIYASMGTRTSNPVEQEARELARKDAKKVLLGSYKRVSDFPKGKWVDVTDQLLAKNAAHYNAEAAKRVAKANEQLAGLNMEGISL